MKKKNPCLGKHREFGNFAKTQGNWQIGKFVVGQGKHREFESTIRVNYGHPLDQTQKFFLVWPHNYIRIPVLGLSTIDTN